MLIALSLAAMRVHAGEPFDVSLTRSSTDLSPYYQAVVREATDWYRGDISGMGQFTTGSATLIRSAGFQIEEHVDYMRGTRTLRLCKLDRSTHAKTMICEAHFVKDAFPNELFSLRMIAGGITLASNQTLQPTTGR